VLLLQFGNGRQAIEILESVSAAFSKCALISLDNQADFDSVIPFDSCVAVRPITPQMATISECRYRWLRLRDLNLIKSRPHQADKLSL
jgi:hypothetical protein